MLILGILLNFCPKRAKKTMSKIAWNKYETALLIDSYCSVIEKKVERAEEVRRLSTILRHIAIDSGLNIDNVFAIRTAYL